MLSAKRTQFASVVTETCLLSRVFSKAPTGVAQAFVKTNPILMTGVARRMSSRVPLCRTHHRDLHSFGDEVVWWERRAIDPLATSRMLRVSTRRIEMKQ
jgi:hypothetical protein